MLRKTVSYGQRSQSKIDIWAFSYKAFDLMVRLFVRVKLWLSDRADALKAAWKPLLHDQFVPSERAGLAQTVEQIALDMLRCHKPERPLGNEC